LTLKVFNKFVIIFIIFSIIKAFITKTIVNNFEELIFMISKNYLDNIPEPTSNILHNSYEKNLTDLSSTKCSEGQFNNLVFNSNLDDSNIIK
ncbi:hypothetical protein, partial [Clostridium paraputrificum]